LRTPERAIDDRRRVPGTEQDADAALRRERHPVTPHRWALRFVLARRWERDGADFPRIHPLVQEVHGLALAGAVDATDDHDDGERLVVAERILGREERLAERGHFPLVIGLFDAMSDLGGLEHGLVTSLSVAVPMATEVPQDRPRGQMQNRATDDLFIA